MKIAEAIEQARAAAETLRAEFPGIEDDLPLWEASIDSLTDATDLADWLVNRALDREQMARMAKERADALRDRGERFKRAAGWSWPAVETAIYDRRERFMRLARQNHRRNLTREAAMRWRAARAAGRECRT